MVPRSMSTSGDILGTSPGVKYGFIVIKSSKLYLITEKRTTNGYKCGSNTWAPPTGV